MMLEPHRKRCKRYDVAGDAHFLTFSCYQRLPLLTKDRSCNWMIEAFQLGRQKDQFDLWAYVVMPEHVHIVLGPHTGTKTSRILSTLKQSVSKRAMFWLSRNASDFLPNLEATNPDGSPTHRFWQRGGGYDRNLRSVRDIHEKIEYVHNNPVRRGLATSPEAWRWSSCRAWMTGADEPIPIDRKSLPSLTDTS
jgi:REP-associated tyrosine transposase